MRASPSQAGLPARLTSSHTVSARKKVYTFTKLIDRLSLMPEVCDLLGLHPDALPDPTTFYHPLDRYAMYV